jgi:hypothetical protein
MTSITDNATTTLRPQGGARVWLSRFLYLDAAVTGVNGLAYLVASRPLGELLGVVNCCSAWASSWSPSPRRWPTWPPGPRHR